MKVTTEDTEYTFAVTDFGFTDVDGDALASVEVVAAPALGTFELDSATVTANTMVTKTQLDDGDLVYTPVANANGKPYTTFTFQVSDGTDESTATYTMTIDVEAVNDAPEASNNEVTMSEDTEYTFAAADFGFTDVDGDALASVEVVAAPTLGTFELDSATVTANTMVTKTQLDDGELVFTPVAGANGDPYTSFTFKVSDGTLESTATYTISIVVAAMNDAPTGANNEVTTNEDTAYRFTAADFGFADGDGDTLASVKVVSPPMAGSLTLDGTTVTANKVVTKTQLDDGELVFTPVANANGKPYTSFNGAGEHGDVALHQLHVQGERRDAGEHGDVHDGDEDPARRRRSGVHPGGERERQAYTTFTFQVSDGTDESAATYTMTIDVEAVNDAPTGAPTITGAGACGSDADDVDERHHGRRRQDERRQQHYGLRLDLPVGARRQQRGGEPHHGSDFEHLHACIGG